MSKQTKEVYILKVQGSVPIVVTGNHPFYVRTMRRTGRGDERKFSPAYWKPVEDMEIVRRNCGAIVCQDYVGIPVNNESKLPEWNGVEYIHNIYGKKQETKVKHNLDMSDPAFWYMVGRYIGDGWLRHDRKETYICCGKAEKEEL